MREQHGHDEAESTKRTSQARPAETGVAGSQPTGLLSSAAHILHLQRTLGNAAVARMIDGEPEAVQRSAVHGVLRSPGRPLDEPVRADMEARFSADFSDVRLHTGPAAQRSATEIGARAYTSGNHVVIGEGGADSRTLAHELTHVIQQRSGPVAGTDNGDGIRISDPSDRFEREAEANARMIMSRTNQVRQGCVQAEGSSADSGAEQALQRRTVWVKKTPDLQRFGEELGRLVEEAALNVLVRPDNIRAQGGRIDRWYRCYGVFIEDRTRTNFLHANFGYAVEALVYAEIKRKVLDKHLPEGWRIATEVDHGTTRPDIVVYDESGTEQGWFDITASESENHIDEKVGSGWATKPNVAEVIYQSLDPDELTIGVGTPADRVKNRRLLEAEKKAENAANEALYKHVSEVAEKMQQALNVGEKRKYFEYAMFEQLDRVASNARLGGDKLDPAVARSILAQIDPSWLAFFGYKGENAKKRDRQALGRILEGLAP